MKKMRDRSLTSRLLIVCGVLMLVFLIGPAAADDQISSSQLPPDAHIIQGAESSAPVAPQPFEGDLRDLPRAPEPAPGAPVIEIPKRVYPREVPAGSDPEKAVKPQSMLDPLIGEDAGVEESVEARLPDAEDSLRVFQTPDLNVAGQDYTGVVPPDTIGDVGRNYYIQMTNHPSGSIFTIRNKQTGAVEAGPALLKDLATGGACTSGHGDPVVLYDNMADRWLLSEFASTGNHLCVYVSKTSDPITGGWWAYDFVVPFFPDYQKYAVWPDAYYASSNEPSPAAYALDRGRMLGGLAATFQRFEATDLAGFGFQALIPADLDGNTQPPAGSPGYFIRHRDDEVHNAGSNNIAQDYLEVWKFKVDFANPALSTFTGPFNIAVSEFDSSLCGLSSFNCFPQPGTSTTLDPLREVVMWRAQYRNFGDHEALVGNFVTDVNSADRGGIRWFELRKDVSAATNWGLFQEGTFAPGSVDNRWMGSIAMDRGGNMALGYSISSSSTYPGIRYTGRLDTTTPGIMYTETTVINGSSYSSTNRWGDYSSMNVDPVDDCTFWYTNEYAKANHQWTTQIARFAHDSCFGPCCNSHPYPGCADKTIQADVCAVDSYCCEVAWDSICVGEVTSEAGDSCDCCESHGDATGCYVPSLPVAQRQDVSDCVCEADPYCCDVQWDSFCADEVESLGCGICPDECLPPEAATNPLPANNAMDVKLESILSWNCDLADSYEDQALSEYTAVDNGGGIYAVTTAAGHDGFFGLEGSQAGGWIYRDDPASLVAQGETFSFWVRPKSNEGRAYVGFGASAAGTYSVIIAPNTDQFLLQRNDGYGYLDIGTSAQTWQNKWYRVEVRWGGGGQITAILFDQDGKTVLNSVNALDDTYTAGGIAFRAFNGPKFMDTAQVCPSPVPAVAAISEALKSRFSYYREIEAPEAAPDAKDNLVWDEANQGYASPESLQPTRQPAAATTVIPEGYSIQNGMLVEGQAKPSIPPDESVSQSKAPATRNVSANIISFDDVTAPCNFNDTIRLTTQYAGLGIIFAGPGGDDGGAILNECGNFNVSGQSSPNFLAFNSGSSLNDGGIPTGPESIYFATPVSEVQANVANGAASGTVTMEAYNAADALVDTMTISLSEVLRPISVAGENIVRVVVSSTATVFVLDDLTWAQWCPITYEVFFGTTNPPAAKICSDIQTTFCDPGNLAENEQYYWQVVTDSPGGSNAGPVWNFTTGKFCECDLDNSGNCNILDYQIFIQAWGQTNCNSPGVVCECDLNVDGSCNILDYQLFIQNWGQSGCSTALERCEPQSCGNYTFDCNPASSSCFCVEAAEGFGSCVNDRACPPAEECVTSDDCPFGYICAINTCCGFGICMPDNSCSDVVGAEEKVLEGPTVSGR